MSQPRIAPRSALSRRGFLAAVGALAGAGALAPLLGRSRGGAGMRRLTREACDFTVRLPMRGTVESLNVSVATGIVLFEALRQRGAKKPG